MADLCHMTAMTDETYNIFTLGLWVSIAYGIWTKEIWLMSPETPTNLFST